MGNLSLNIEIKTVMALDNASIHKVHKVYKILNLQAYWQKEDYLFFSPPYSPPLNIAEGLWKKIEEDWIKPSNYLDANNLFYVVDRICANIGKTLLMNFSKYSF